MASSAYQRGVYALLNGDVLFTSATIKVLLVTSSYTFNKDHDSLSDITNEISVGGYSRQTLAGKTVTVDDTNDRVKIDADDPVFTSLVAGQTIAAAVVFYDTGVAGTSLLIAYIDVTDTATNGGTVTVNFHADGILYAST